MELEIREANEPDTPMTKPMEEIKKIYCEKLQLEA